MALNGELRPTTKPDIDNLAKGIKTYHKVPIGAKLFETLLGFTSESITVSFLKPSNPSKNELER